MKPTSFALRPLRVVGVLALSACYSADCVTMPCLLPMALTVTVTNAASGGAVPTAVIQLGGQSTSSITCSSSPTVCVVPGYRGTYSVTVSAPGFQSATRTITVAGPDVEECHCATVDTEHVNVALVPNSSAATPPSAATAVTDASTCCSRYPHPSRYRPSTRPTAPRSSS